MQSMEEIYQQYAQTVYRYLFSLVRDPDLAEELTQETFYQAIRSIDRYDASCKITTWLCAIAKNALRTHRRKHPPTEAIEDQPLQTPSAEADYLRSLGNLSFREIGELLGRSENWARVTFYRAKEKLGKDEDHAKPSL